MTGAEWTWAVLFVMSIAGSVAGIIDAARQEKPGLAGAGGLFAAIYIGVPAIVATGAGWLIAWLI